MTEHYKAYLADIAEKNAGAHFEAFQITPLTADQLIKNYELLLANVIEFHGPKAKISARFGDDESRIYHELHIANAKKQLANAIAKFRE